MEKKLNSVTLLVTTCKVVWDQLWEHVLGVARHTISPSLRSQVLPFSLMMVTVGPRMLKHWLVPVNLFSCCNWVPFIPELDC